METWNDVFKAAIMLVVALAGAPVTQLIKRGLSALLKKQVEDRPALAMTVVVAFGFALTEKALAGAFQLDALTPQTLPVFIGGVFSLMSIYFAWMKNSESLLGKGFLLKS